MLKEFFKRKRRKNIVVKAKSNKNHISNSNLKINLSIGEQLEKKKNSHLTLIKNLNEC
jgi:hypothetical protein